MALYDLVQRWLPGERSGEVLAPNTVEESVYDSSTFENLKSKLAKIDSRISVLESSTASLLDNESNIKIIVTLADYLDNRDYLNQEVIMTTEDSTVVSSTINPNSKSAIFYVDKPQRVRFSCLNLEGTYQVSDYCDHKFSFEDATTFWNGSLESTSWDNIHKIIELGKAQEFMKVGDIKRIELSTGEKMMFAVGGFNLYKSNTVTFISKYVMRSPGRRINATNNSSGGWEDSELRKMIREEILPTFPQDLAQYFDEKLIRRGVGYSSDANAFYLPSTGDKLWIPSRFEVIGNSRDHSSDSGAMKEYLHHKRLPFFLESSNEIGRYNPEDEGYLDGYVWQWSSSPTTLTTDNNHLVSWCYFDLSNPLVSAKATTCSNGTTPNCGGIRLGFDMK